MSNNRPRDVSGFVRHLEGLDAGGRARLKRNAGRTLAESRDVLSVFFSILPGDVVREQDKETYFLVATLYAFGTRRDGIVGGVPRSLGASLRRIRGDDNERRTSLNKRVGALLEADREQLPFRLRQIVSLLKANEVAVNWAILLRDVLSWEHPDRWVQRQWAEHYYVGAYEVPTTSSDNQDATLIGEGERQP